MSHRILKRVFAPFVPIGVMALVIAGPVPLAGADHHGKTKYRFVETGRSAVVWQSPDYPQVGSSSISAALGTFHRTTVSTGEVKVFHTAQRVRSVVTGYPTPGSLTLKIYGVSYFGDGTTRRVEDATVTLQPDGSVHMVGTGRIIGGTGSRKGIRGQITSFSGDAASPTSPWFFHARGVSWY